MLSLVQFVATVIKTVGGSLPTGAYRNCEKS
jgi:hypothetical protein